MNASGREWLCSAYCGISATAHKYKTEKGNGPLRWDMLREMLPRLLAKLINA